MYIYIIIHFRWYSVFIRKALLIVMADKLGGKLNTEKREFCGILLLILTLTITHTEKTSLL